MLVNVGVFSGAKVATEEERFNSFEEGRIGSHHVRELAVLRASLAHNDLAVLFENLRFEFAGMLVHQRLERRFASNHGGAHFLHAARTKRVSLSGKTKWRRGSFVGF